MTELEQKEFEFHAKQLLNNPVFISLLSNVKAGIGRAMDTVKPSDLQEIQAITIKWQALTEIVDYISVAAESSKVSDFNAKRKRNLFNR